MPHLLRVALFACLACFVSPLSALAERADEQPAMSSVLRLDRVGVGRRSTVNTDAIEYHVATGSFMPPKEGDEVTAPDGSVHQWEAMPVGESGGYGPIAGGWAYATVMAESDSIWVLKGSGYRHVYVNGEPRVGDLYGLGIVSLPIRLQEGENTFLFKAGRGGFSLEFAEPPAEVFLETRDSTLPDYVRGDTSEVFAGVLICNATDRWLSGLTVRAGSGETMTSTEVTMLPPLATQKIPVRLPPCPACDDESVRVRLEIVGDETMVGEPIDLNISVRDANQKHSRTFISGIDGSVQYFGVTPPTDATIETPAEPKSLLLTLHGASVEGRGQSNAYAPKENMYIVAPTNRRPFGFDWEDWGRLDAIEVLDIASELFNADPARVYLSGHSMGGHGTWTIGAYHAGRFAAIAPSAGWRDFWSYGGGAEYDTDTELGRLLDRAANASRTLLMEHNYFDLGVYILHGDADDNVPVEQARFMRDQLADSHDNFGYYEQPGAGHWWGNRCVDWAPMFAMFDYSRIDPAAPRVDFTTVDPGIASKRAWVTIDQQLVAREASRVVAEYDRANHVVHVEPSNVASLSLDLSVFTSEDQPEAPSVQLAGMDGTLNGSHFTRVDETTWVASDADPAAKSPARNGPFKDALRHDMLAVVGTAGTPDENAWALAKARYDAESFWYRGNGSIDIVRDTDFDPSAEPDRSVILYGNASSNAAWGALLGDAPIQVANGKITLGSDGMDRNDLGILMAYPRPGSDVAMVAVIGGSGIVGMRTTDQFPFVTSGVHYPDWFIASPEIYLKADAGVVGAGFFGLDWSLGEDFVIRDD